MSIRKGEKRSSEKAVNSTLKNYVHLLFCLYICNGFCFSLFFSMRIRQKLFCFLIKVSTQVRLIFIFFRSDLKCVWIRSCEFAQIFYLTCIYTCIVLDYFVCLFVVSAAIFYQFFHLWLICADFVTLAIAINDEKTKNFNGAKMLLSEAVVCKQRWNSPTLFT